MARLSEPELVCAEVLVGKGRSIRSIAGDLGVDESTLRYRLKRRKDGAKDGRSQRPEAAAAVSDVIEGWIDAQDWSGEGGDLPEAVRVLYERLVHEHGFSGEWSASIEPSTVHTEPESFERAVDDLYRIVEERLEEAGVSPTLEEVSAIASSVDVDEVLRDNNARAIAEDVHFEAWYEDSCQSPREIDDLDDLFDRSAL